MRKKKNIFTLNSIPLAVYGWDERRINVLATYNSEVSRGIKHTKEWCDKMANEQINYNNASDTRYAAQGYERFGDGWVKKGKYGW